MAQLGELTRGAAIRGILPDGLVTVVDVQWYGPDAVELTYKDAAGRLGNELLFRDREPTLEVVTEGRPWSFDGDGALFRLVSEAHRIRAVKLSTALPEQAAIRHVVGQGMLERVPQLGEQTRLIEQLGRLEAREPAPQPVLV